MEKSRDNTDTIHRQRKQRQTEQENAKLPFCTVFFFGKMPYQQYQLQVYFH